jgi:hypothetical protein
MRAEAEQVARVARDHAQRVALIPWVPEEPVGVERVRALVAQSAPEAGTPAPGPAPAPAHQPRL